METYFDLQKAPCRQHPVFVIDLLLVVVYVLLMTSKLLTGVEGVGGAGVAPFTIL